MMKCLWKLSWRYDSGGRLTEEVQDGVSIRHGYTASGQYAGRESDGGNRVGFGYNDAGQLSRIQLNDEPASLLAYDALGRLREEQLTPELKRELSYNENGWLSAQRVSREARPLFSTEWYYDLNGNVRQRNDSVSGREFFSHDVMDRLVQHTDVLGRITHFVYDAAGNRLQEDISGSGDEWQCRGRVEEEGLVTLEHRYNRNGQLVARKRRTPTLWSQTVVSESLEWDVSGRLTALHSGNASTQYGYDGLGRRVFKKTSRAGEDSASLTWFWWDGDALAGEAQDTVPVDETLTAACDMQIPGSSAAREARLLSLVAGRTVQEYVYYPQSFEPLALIRYGRRWSERDGFSEPEKRIYFYHNDVNGAPLRLTDEYGGLAWSQRSGPWGAWNEQTGSVRNPLRFQGQYFDEESGLHYNRYRYYEPESGRYISADPIGLAGGLNLYAYAPNPLSWIDPLGLSKRCDYLGRTPGKNSRTGREVIDRMRADGKIVGTGKNTRFEASDGSWHPLNEADMSHKTDAVTWWNNTGRYLGPKSKPVRDWMLNSDNYYLDHYSINRSQGAQLGQVYLPPIVLP
ncbi:hypothetical protein DPD21_10030 [Salmonella enterica subsp. enterica serovar Remiremont]|nr:hypothetical protein [Salmonella enterica subsp. enterica serovar Remiremont]